MARRISGALLILWLSGCSLFGPRQQTITVSSDPPGALVLVNGERVGTTPLQTKVSRSGDLLIELQLDGYQTEYRSTQRMMSVLGTLDVLGGSAVIVPFLGLLSPAAWEQDPSTFGVTMTPNPP